MSARVFVYGTLRRGEPLHGALATATFMREARTEPKYRLLHLGAYPAMAHGGKTSIVGEVYEVDERTLRRLDQTEGHPHFYCRTPIRLDDGTAVEAYVLQKYADEPEIESGDWFDEKDHDRGGWWYWKEKSGDER